MEKGRDGMIHVTAVGRITKDIDVRPTNGGTPVANFTLACKRKIFDQDGKKKTTFVDCVIWGKPAQVIAKYTQKGLLISAEGELQSRSYDDRDGVTHYVTELIIDYFDFLESKVVVENRERQQQYSDS